MSLNPSVTPRELSALVDEARGGENAAAFLSHALKSRSVARDCLISLTDTLAHDRADILEVLLAHGAHPDATSGLGVTPICYAALYGAVSCTRLLLDRGARVDQVYLSGQNPLTWAMDKWQNSWATLGEGTASERARVARNKKRECARMLLEQGSAPNETGLKGVSPMHMAAGMGEGADIDLLVEFGGNVNLRNLWSEATPLLSAAAEGNLATTLALIRHGAEIDYRDSSGRDARAVAAEKGHAAVADALLAARQQQALEKSVASSGAGRLRM